MKKNRPGELIAKHRTGIIEVKIEEGNKRINIKEIVSS